MYPVPCLSLRCGLRKGKELWGCICKIRVERNPLRSAEALLCAAPWGKAVSFEVKYLSEKKLKQN